MALFVRSQIPAWKIMYEIDLGPPRFTPTFWSQWEVLLWFNEHVDAGDGVVFWEFLRVTHVVDPGDHWYLEYYGLRDHDVFFNWA